MTQSSSSAPRSAFGSVEAQLVDGAAPTGAAECERPADSLVAASLSAVEVNDGTAVPRGSRRSPLRRLGGVLRRGSSSDVSWSSVGTTAVVRVVVMGVSGVSGLVNSSLIIRHFEADALAQYNLLATFPTLMPFTDLGVGAVILSTMVSSSDLARDSTVWRMITAAARILLGSTLVISTVGIVVMLLGAQFGLLGDKLMKGGGLTAAVCLIVCATALPLSMGQWVAIGLGRSATQVISQGVVSPVMSCFLLLAIVTGLGRGNAVSIYSYIASTLVSVICIVIAWRATRPLLREAFKDVPRLRNVRGVRIANTAGSQLLQSLVIPIAFQTDQLLLSHLGQSQALTEYGLANRLLNMLTQTAMAASVAMWPMFARARADKRVESPSKSATAFSGGGFPLALVLVAITPWTARVMPGGEVVLPSVLVWAFAAYVAVEAGKQPLGVYTADLHGLQLQVTPVLILVPMNLVISWVLIGPFDAAGPILGSVISVVLCQIFPYAWWVRRDVVRRRRELAQQ